MIKYFILLSIILSNISFSQVITTIPEFPTENDSIILIFNAAEGDAGLQGYVGDVYVHTGVTTNLGAWQHVIGDWGDDTNQPQLTRIGTDLYQLDIGNPREFYAVESYETIETLNFVFRSATSNGPTGRDVGGADIFLALFEEGINVKITSPDNDVNILELYDSLNVTVNSNLADTLQLFLNDNLLEQTIEDVINYKLFIDEPGEKWLIAKAISGTEMTVDSAHLFIRTQPKILEVPQNIVEGINYNSESSVTLNLFAPEKEYVFVVGSFNNWDLDSNYQMHKSPNDSTFWLTINNLTPQVEYAFQYLVNGELLIADPYTEKTLDPNDKYISETIFPGLMDYPENKTKNIASIIQTNKEEYIWTSNDYVKPEKTDLVIYEMWIRNFLEEHSYATLIDTLDYLSNLGINAIELMPINEFEGNDSWGYNPSFYFAVDKNYGPSNDLKRFIDECHSRGIAVIIDMVLNHSYGQNPMVQLYFDKFANNEIVSLPSSPWFNVSSPNRSFYWGADFNHESPYTKKFMDRVNTFWLSEYKVDGFRFDFTKGFTNRSGDGWAKDASRIAILKRMADVIWQTDSSAYVILEHLSDNTEEKELADYGMMLWGNMNHNYNEATMGYNENNKSNLSGAYYKNRGWNEPNLVAYMESHDEERLMFKNLQYGNSNGSYSIKNLSQALSRIKLASAFFYTIPGPKMIWQFGELGFEYSINWPEDCRLCIKPFVWNYLSDLDRSNLYKTTQALIKLKLENEAFKSEDVTLSVSGAVKRIKITHESMNIVVMGNFDVVDRTIIPSFHNEGIWYDYFSGDSINVLNTQSTLPLSPGEFHIYTSVKLETPEQDILSDTEELNNIVPTSFSLSQNYPNPFNPSTTIKFSIPDNIDSHSNSVTLKIYDVLGNELKTLVNKNMSPGNYTIDFDAKEFSSGIYFYTLSTNGFYKTKKMILLK